MTSRPSAGLTLIEVLVALTLVSIVTALTVPAFDRAIDTARFDSAAREILNGLKRARREAIRTQSELTFTLDTATGQFALGSGTQPDTAATGFEYELVTAGAEVINGSRGAIRFFSDGSSTGGTIRLSNGARVWIIETDWLTGRVRVTK